MVGAVATVCEAKVLRPREWTEGGEEGGIGGSGVLRSNASTSGLETEAVRIEEREREEEKETARETVRDRRVEDLGVAVGYIGGV